MISLYGCGFVGGKFKSLYTSEVEVQERDDRYPHHNEILYMISTIDNYNVHDKITLDVDTNLKILCEVLDYCRSEDIIFNFVSSWFVYGKGGDVPAREDSPCDPTGFYSITKKCAEDLIISFAQTTGMKYRILRLCNVMGEGDTKASKKKNAIQWMVNELKADRDIKVYDHGSHCRDIMHVEDVCRAIKLIMDKGDLNEIYKAHDLLQYRAFGYGHSFGVLSHYFGREAGLELREDIETVLEPNMVVSMEPMIMLPEGISGSGGYREHDILVVTKDGSDNITEFPYGPAHNIVCLLYTSPSPRDS